MLLIRTQLYEVMRLQQMRIQEMKALGDHSYVE